MRSRPPSRYAQKTAGCKRSFDASVWSAWRQTSRCRLPGPLQSASSRRSRWLPIWSFLTQHLIIVLPRVHAPLSAARALMNTASSVAGSERCVGKHPAVSVGCLRARARLLAVTALLKIASSVACRARRVRKASSAFCSVSEGPRSAVGCMRPLASLLTFMSISGRAVRKAHLAAHAKPAIAVGQPAIQPAGHPASQSDGEPVSQRASQPSVSRLVERDRGRRDSSVSQPASQPGS
eukprot:352263-Chlamydomonas_euryale.AAC.1